MADDQLLSDGSAGIRQAWKRDEVIFSNPVIYTRHLRDFYAFEQHVKTANENRGRSVPEEWYQFPVFYFTNPSTTYGDGDTIPYPSYTDALDYELEIACVIGKAGIDIPADQAEEHIFGFTIMNDWSARDVQRIEMKVGLGPAKGKDFATSLGPCIVTLDELADKHTGRPGVYDLEMVARVNGVERSRGNMKDLYWSFGQMIERASQDVWLQPGDVIGSGHSRHRLPPRTDERRGTLAATRRCGRTRNRAHWRAQEYRRRKEKMKQTQSRIVKFTSLRLSSFATLR